MRATEQFVAHALGTPTQAIPHGAVLAAKTFILDTAGVGIAGARAHLSSELLDCASQWGQATPEHHAGVLGRDVRLPPPSAAFINGFQIHCQEYDCVHEPAVVHPMATIFAALLTDCDGRGAASISGREFITAVILAVDVAASLGVAVTSPIRFFRPANAGLFGATLGLARLRGFTPEQAKNALGYALAHCSGTMQAHVEGKPALPIQIGNAARAAILACDLADVDIPGPHDVFEGPFGYFPLFEERWDLEPVLEQLGQTLRITEVSHKPFPTGRAAQGGIVAVQKLRAQGVTAENLRKLTLRAPPIIPRLVGRPMIDDMSVNYARLCFPYCGAVTLTQGTVLLSDFDVHRLRDPALRALAECIRVVDDGTKNPAAFAPQTAIAELQDGSTCEVTIDALYGSPTQPMSKDAQLEKLRGCLEFGWGQGGAAHADDLAVCVSHLEDLPSLEPFLQLITGLSPQK